MTTGKGANRPNRGRSRSGSPSRVLSGAAATTRGLSRSGSIEVEVKGGEGKNRSRNGRNPSRSASPSRNRRARSGSPSRMRGRSGSPSRNMRARSRSGSPSRRMRARSQARGRSGSPSRNMRARSRSGSRMRGRSRSGSPSGRMRGRSRSGSQNGLPRGRSRSGSGSAQGGRKRRRRRRFRHAYDDRGKLSPSDDSCTKWQVISYAVPLILLIASSVGLLMATGNGDKLKKLVPNISSVTDPFAGFDPNSVALWRSNGNGLTVDIVNALDDSWQVLFSLAQADWEFGNPDALTLPSSRIAHETRCDAVEGKIKVCNGNYGETNWRGINQLVTDDQGFVTASAAKMNDFYLNPEGQDAKQYTICHELGHAFGLPHTDENFDNEDLGNCLDYTNNFSFNKHPDATNYEALAQNYGLVRGLRGRRLHVPPKGGPSMPGHLRQRMLEAVTQLEQRKDDNAHEDGWKLLHRTKHGEEHEMHLGEGYRIRVHKLLA